MANLKIYSISVSMPSGINLSKLHNEILASGNITNFDGLVTDPDNSDNLIVMGDALLDETSLDALISAHDPTPLPDYIVRNLVNKEFVRYKVENIDFTRHLTADMALNKKVTKSLNGRPDTALYYNGTELVAEIFFYFETNADNLLTRRQEHLYYYKTDGSKGPRVLIKDKTYNMSDLIDGETIINERVDARNSIVSSAKAFLGGALQMSMQLPLSDIVQIIKPFWDEFDIQRRNFIDLGDPAWKDELALINLSTTPYTFLSAVIDAQGTTMRDYIVYRLSY